MKEVTYNRAKSWQLALFPLNNTATNAIMFLMTFVTYLYTGGIGASVVFISSFLTGMRVFDAITDPLIGAIIDKTKTKFGKFRPIIVLGYGIMLVSLAIMYFMAPVVSQSMRLPIFVISYILYIVGYTFQTACTKSGQTCLSNDPKQRPVFMKFDSLYNMILFAAGPMYVSSYLAPKYHGFTLEAMQEFAILFIAIAGICTVLALIALSGKDVPENWGGNEDTMKLGVKDYWEVIRNNRAIQMLVVAAATDKLALQCAKNSSILIMLYGIIIGNYSLQGKMSMLITIPAFIVVMIGTEYAKKFGSKKALVICTYLDIALYGLLFALLLFGDPTKISLSNFGFMTIAFMVLMALADGMKNISGGIVIPMIADCSDYEKCRTGKYVPGMMGTLFSFVDKMISSLATTVVGFLLVGIGYTSTLPQPTDLATPAIFRICMLTFIGLPLIGWVCSLIAMKFYPLDDKKMEEIQEELAQRQYSEKEARKEA